MVEKIVKGNQRVEPCKFSIKKLVFATHPNFLISVTLEHDSVNLDIFNKLRLFNLTKFIVLNIISGHWVAKI